MRTIGSKLDSRPAGREAWLAMQPRLREVPQNEEVVLDFDGVELLTPSFADEFVTPLVKDYGGYLKLRNTAQNITVQKTLLFLAQNWSSPVALE